MNEHRHTLTCLGFRSGSTMRPFALVVAIASIILASAQQDPPLPACPPGRAVCITAAPDEVRYHACCHKVSSLTLDPFIGCEAGSQVQVHRQGGLLEAWEGG